MDQLAEDMAGKRRFLGKFVFHLRQISPGFRVKERRGPHPKILRGEGKENLLTGCNSTS